MAGHAPPKVLASPHDLFWRLRFSKFTNMEFLHSQLSKIQDYLSFVSVDPINWKFYVQAFSWGVTLFESYLLCVSISLYRSVLRWPNAYKACVSIHYTLKQSHLQLSQAISAQRYSRNRKNMGKTRPSSHWFRDCSNNVLTRQCFNMDFMHGLGL